MGREQDPEFSPATVPSPVGAFPEPKSVRDKGVMSPGYAIHLDQPPRHEPGQGRVEDGTAESNGGGPGLSANNLC